MFLNCAYCICSSCKLKDKLFWCNNVLTIHMIQFQRKIVLEIMFLNRAYALESSSLVNGRNTILSFFWSHLLVLIDRVSDLKVFLCVEDTKNWCGCANFVLFLIKAIFKLFASLLIFTFNRQWKTLLKCRFYSRNKDYREKIYLFDEEADGEDNISNYGRIAI